MQVGSESASKSNSNHRPVSSSQDRQSNPDVLLATEVLAGTKPIELGQLKELVQGLRHARYFDLARQVSTLAVTAAAHDPGMAVWFSQQQALSTYKDPDLPVDQRLDDALAILREKLQLATTSVQETLGLAGAIFKRKWEIDNQAVQLERSLAFYRRGYQQGIGKDDGYTAINAAFVLDLLAAQDDRAAAEYGIDGSAEARRAEATRIREGIVAALSPKVQQHRSKPDENFWFLLATLSEASFGLGRYEAAVQWLREGLTCKPADWEFESTARQLAEIARLQSKLYTGDGEHPSWKALRELLGDQAAAASTIKIGKVGISLSGGGFRASLFHIGVLARLAECDLLRHIEVLSCVSGGSIVGAHYYLEVRHLLQTKKDKDILRQDYLDLVARIADKFLVGIQRNIRCRLMSEFFANLKMALVPDYSTTRRLGELYEENIYRLVEDGHQGERWLNDLIVVPKDEGSEFTPKLDNWRRHAKVPILILNATTLNTGHNWQFTASWMGETPAGITAGIDANDRLRRLYYWQAPPEHQKIRLGHAVAASACVPGLFEPLVIAGLYPDRIVHLVDGGLHDNQGVDSLLEQDCSIFLVSDATGQMQTIRKPRSELLELPMRASAILMARVREAEYRELEARRKSSLIRGLMFLHLKKGLDVKPIDWIGAENSDNRAGNASTDIHETTDYQVAKAAQEQLAAIRTDLDSFNDTEAFALMASGYLMTKRDLPDAFNGVEGIDTTVQTDNWQFLRVQGQLAAWSSQGDAGRRFIRLLEVSCSTLGKSFRLAPLRAIASWIIPVIGVAAIIGAISYWIDNSFPPFQQLAGAIWHYLYAAKTACLDAIGYMVRTRTVLVVGTALILLAAWIVTLYLARRKSLTQFTYGLLFAAVGWLSWIHLLTTDRLYLRLGRLKQSMHR